MQITRNELDITVGPSDWFAGPVYIDVVGTPTPPSRVVGGVVHFAPRARTAWHTHPVGQTIFVTEGIGLCLREGGPVEELRPGDRVYFEPGENHWHGAAPSATRRRSPTRRPTSLAVTPPGGVTSPTTSIPARAGPLPRRATRDLPR
jgi:quercetin dioxygenase-like cupin family protein